MRATALLLALLCVSGGPVPCEVAARPDKGPAPRADVAPVKLGIAGPARVDPYRLVRLTAQGGPAGAAYLWDVEPLDDPAAVVDYAGVVDGEALTFVAPPGRYRVELLAVAGGDRPKISRVRHTVTIGPPGPAPQPKPPKPDDPPAPKPVGDFRVLFVRESGAPTPTYLQSAELLAYLNRKCAKAANGLAEWRVYDPQQVVTDRESPTMKALWEAVKPKLGGGPQVAVGVGSSVTLLPLPADLPALMTTLKKYGGE